MTIEVAPVASRDGRRLFRDLPSRLHGDDPAFIPMLDMALNAVLDRKKNPFWKHAEGVEWLARRDGEAVGRVGACVDQLLLGKVPGTGVVGFWDCGDDAEVAAALFDTAGAWLRERGCTRARGPLNYSMHDTAGVLVEGFDTQPTVDTTWNPDHYDPLWTASGWHGAQDMLACAGWPETGGPARAHKFAERCKRQGVTVRGMDFGRFLEEAELLRQVYNDAWAENWGHVPIPADEFAYKAKDMKAVIDPDMIRVAEQDGKVIGLLLALPDLNVAIRRCGGKLFPFGWWHLLRARKTAKRARCVLLGVVPGFRVRGVETAMLADSYAAFQDRYPWNEASWVLADNAAMLNALKLYNLEPYKRWRVYEKDL